MRTRRGGAQDAAEPSRGARTRGGVKKKAAKKKAGAVVAKRVVLRGRTTTRATEAAREPQPAGPSGSSAARQPAEQQRQPDGDRSQQKQRRHSAPVAAARGKRPAAGGSGGKKPFDSEATVLSLTAEALQEVFVHLSRNEQQSYCREILPLVCKRFREVLQEPSAVWETLHINFIQKGQDLAMPALRPPSAEAGDGSNRRLLRSAVEKWVAPRAAAVKRLVLSFSSRDQTHSFPKSGAGVRRLFQLLAPSLQELCVAHCSDIFHAASFADVALLQSLETLAVTFHTGRIVAADLAPLEGMRRLRSLSLVASQAEETSGKHCFVAFPDSLLRLKGLTSLTVSSQGITSLPANITKLKQLQCLDLSGCNLTFLPSQMWRLSALRRLRLNGTAVLVQLQHVWDPLAKLPALEALELRDVKATGLPPTLTGLTALTSLDLSDNQFETLAGQANSMQALASLPNLQRLSLRCCQLPSVPADVCQMTGLTHLDLSRNQLVELPEGLSLLDDLRELVAEGNCFPRIPQVLAQLSSLETADLSFNIYMEAASSLLPLLGDDDEPGFMELQRLDLRKMLGVWKQSSIRWLEGLVEALAKRHAQWERNGFVGEAPQVLWD